MSLSDWYHVRIHDHALHLDVSPPGGEPWHAEIAWSDISRVCFKAADLFESDEWYFFTRHRPQSYVVPVEADGGLEILTELVSRGLLDADLSIQASASGGGLFCWPPAEA